MIRGEGRVNLVRFFNLLPPLKNNLLTLKSDQHLISPYNLTSKSNIKVARKKEMISI